MVDIFGVITKLEYFLGLISTSFLKVNVQNRNIFGALLKFQIFFFWVCLIFLIIFWVKQKLLGPSLRSMKNEYTPHTHTPGRRPSTSRYLDYLLNFD